MADLEEDACVCVYVCDAYVCVCVQFVSAFLHSEFQCKNGVSPHV